MISYNVNGQAVRDRGYFMEHIRRLRPRWLLVMDDWALALAIARDLPGTNVIYRRYPDDGVPTSDPAAWVAERAAMGGAPNIWHYTCNEPPFTPALHAWHLNAMREALRRSVKLCIYNLPVGTPEPNQWSEANEVLRMLASARDHFVLGLHEGACGFIGSGMPRYTEWVRPPNAWPSGFGESDPLWHSGRFRFLVRYCRDREIATPRIVMTEFGFDYLADVQAWAGALKRTPPYADIRGWKTLVAQWRDWWPEWSVDRAYYEQLNWVWRAVYANSPVEALLLFTWSAAPDWEQFDVSELRGLHAMLEAASKPSQPIGANPPVNDERWRPYRAQAAPAGTVVRVSPSVSSAAVTTLRGTVNVHHIPFELLTTEEKARADQPGHRWHLVKTGDNLIGWARGDVITLTPLSAEPPPAVQAITRADLDAAVETLRRELQAWALERFAAPDAVSAAIDARLRQLGERIAAAWLSR